MVMMMMMRWRGCGEKSSGLVFAAAMAGDDMHAC